MANLTQNIAQVNADFQAIKTKIKNCGVEVADGTPTSQYSDKVSEVYEAGKQAEHDLLWDAIQKGGTRAVYQRIFEGAYWTDESFRPKYDIKPTGQCAQMFDRTGIKDLTTCIERSGITFDVSKATGLNNLFYNSQTIERVPVINVTGIASLTNITGLFGACKKLKTIDKLVIKNDGSTMFNLVFSGCDALENLTIEGVIGQHGFSVGASTKLSKTSITSIINALSTTTSGLTVTLSQTAVNAAFTTDEWNALVATKTNWTISLI